MVAIVGSAQIARQLDQVRLIRILNQDLTRQSQQLSSGRILDGLLGVAPKAQELADLKAEMKTVESYKNATLSAQNRTRLYGVTMEQMIDVAIEAKDLMIKNREAFFASTSAPTVQINGLIDRVTVLLQTKDGDRFLYGGRNYTTNPINSPISSAVTDYIAGAVPDPLLVTDETTAVGPAPPYQISTTVSAAQQPPWLNATDTDQVENYYFDTTGVNGTTETRFVGLSVDDNEYVEYGISAVHPAFQRLIDAMVRFRSANQDINGGNLYTQRVDDARAQLETAISNLKTLASSNGHAEQRLAEVQKRHDRALDILKTRIAGIENADIAETATTVKALQTALEASYTITRDSLQLSLVQFLR